VDHRNLHLPHWREHLDLSRPAGEYAARGTSPGVPTCLLVVLSAVAVPVAVEVVMLWCRG
jgi:hypothetical protein